MAVIINVEHFELSSESKEKILEKLSKLNRIVPAECSTRLFLKQLAKGRYSAILQVHAGKQDFAASATGDEVLGLVTSVERFVHRQLVEENHRRIHDRRHAF